MRKINIDTGRYGSNGNSGKSYESAERKDNEESWEELSPFRTKKLKPSTYLNPLVP